jgi:hypothetical protein
MITGTVLGSCVPAQTTQRSEAIEARQHDIEENQVRALAEGQFQPAFSVAGTNRLISALAQHMAECRHNRARIIDDQNLHSRPGDQPSYLGSSFGRLSQTEQAPKAIQLTHARHSLFNIVILLQC